MSTTNSIDLGGLSKQYAARDLPGQLKLKYRDIGQAAPDEVRKDKKELRRELEEREKLSSKKDSSSSSKRLSLTENRESERVKKLKADQTPVNLDADEILKDSDSDEDEEDLKKKSNFESDEDNESNDSDDDDEDDDTEALMAELNKIKQERAAEAARLEAERKSREEKIRVENILKGNPLLNPQAGPSEFKVKRRWDDDVVFKNCAKNDSDNKKKDFINDTLRSEFHRKFMDRYIK